MAASRSWSVLRMPAAVLAVAAPVGSTLFGRQATFWVSLAARSGSTLRPSAFHWARIVCRRRKPHNLDRGTGAVLEVTAYGVLRGKRGRANS